MKNLSFKQKAFVEHYAACGNATEAAKRAGYAERYARKNSPMIIRHPQVQAALAEITEKTSSERIATIEERQEFWTTVLRGRESGADMKDRLKASELLGRCQGDFIERVESTGVHEIIVRYVQE